MRFLLLILAPCLLFAQFPKSGGGNGGNSSSGGGGSSANGQVITPSGGTYTAIVAANTSPQIFSITLTASVTSTPTLTLTNATNGQQVGFNFIENVTGGWTVIMPANFLGACAPDTGAGVTTTIIGTYNGTNVVNPTCITNGPGHGISLPQSTTPDYAANSWNIFGNTSIATAFGWQGPTAAATGLLRGDATGTTVAISQGEISGDCVSSGSNAVTCAGFVKRIANGTVSLGTTTVNTGTCSSGIDGGTATNVLSTDVVTASANGSPIAVTGYTPATTGTLYVWAIPSAGHVTFFLCNNTGSNITPGSAVTLNWMVAR